MFLSGLYGAWGCGPGAHWFFGGGIGMMISGVLLLIAIIAVVVLLFRRSSGRIGLSGSAPSAMEVLKKRYARGEISQGEFLEMKKDLQGE